MTCPCFPLSYIHSRTFYFFCLSKAWFSCTYWCGLHYTMLLLCRLYLLPWFVGNAEVLQWCAVVYPGVFPVTSGSLFKCSFLCLCGEIFCSEKLCYQNVGSFENFCWRVHTFVRYLLMWFRNLWLGNKFLCTFWYLTIRTCRLLIYLGKISQSLLEICVCLNRPELDSELLDEKSKVLGVLAADTTNGQCLVGNYLWSTYHFCKYLALIVKFNYSKGWNRQESSRTCYCSLLYWGDPWRKLSRNPYSGCRYRGNVSYYFFNPLSKVVLTKLRDTVCFLDRWL